MLLPIFALAQMGRWQSALKPTDGGVLRKNPSTTTPSGVAIPLPICPAEKWGGSKKIELTQLRLEPRRIGEVMAMPAPRPRRCHIGQRIVDE